jgi:XTP/dITP diphosphohydrolase
VPVIVLATRNKGKIQELSGLLKDFGLEVKGLDSFPEVPEVAETGVTFEENALLKACTVSKATGLIAVADDSGLEVDALGGRPGVQSARYSDEDNQGRESSGRERDARNNQKLLRELAAVPEAKRTARFRCVMAACAPQGESITASGAWEGRIAAEPAGEQGFGYDPVFFDVELRCTAAELRREEKNARSHRGRALRKLLEAWPGFWNEVGRTQ